MKFTQLSVAAAVSALTFTTATNAVLGPIPIYLNTEYRTENPVIGSIASTLSFNADDIKATGANTFLDFLDTVPSVGLFNAQGNVPAIYMRGGDSHHTLVLVDGVKMSPVGSGKGAIEYGLTSIPLNDIEKIEIVKGSSSVLYGSSAVSGVISITTKKGANGKEILVNTKIGYNNSKTYTVSLSNGDKNGYIRLSHNKHITDGFNARTDDTTGEKDGINNHTTQIKVGNENFNISYLKSRDKTEYDSPVDGLGDRKFSKVSLNTSKSISESLDSNFSITQTQERRNSGSNATTIGDKFKRTDITILNDIKIDEALVNIGISKFKDENVTDNISLNSNEIFANWQKNVYDIDVNTGVRFIDHSKFGNETVYNLGAAKYLDNGLKLTGSYATAFNAPSLPYLLDYYGGENPNLNPETSKSAEIGLEKSHDWGASTFKLFKTNTKNAIGGWPLVNQDTYLAKGMELSTNTNIDGYDINFGYTFAKSRVNNASTQAKKRPKNIANLSIKKNHEKLNSKVQLISKSSSSISNGEKVGGYTLLNLSSTYDINNDTGLSLNIDNATDKDYQISGGDDYRYNQPGRTIELGLSYNF